MFTPLAPIFGRQLKIHQYYKLPADPEERSRLDLEHDMLTSRMGGLYSQPALVHSALLRRESRILDVGAGTGKWAVEMAQQFPDAEILGIDITDVDFTTPPPLNCRFEVDDVNKGLPHYRAGFDLVHARGVGDGIGDYNGFVDDMYLTLRPGGVLLVVEWDSIIRDENGVPVTAEDEQDPGFSWTAKYMMAAKDSIRATSSSELRLACVTERTEWEHRGSEELMIPLGPWNDAAAHGNERRTAELLREDFIMLCSSFRPALLLNGYEEQTVDTWLRNAQQELRNGVHRLNARWVIAWVRKAETA